MPQVPTILADQRLQGSVPLYNPRVGEDLTGEAVERLGHSMSRSAAMLGQMAEARGNMESAKWVGDSMTQEQVFINDWMAKPENNSKESFAEDLHKLLDERMKVYEDAAPNERARQAFRSNFQSFSVSRLKSAQDASAANRISGMQNSAVTQIENVVDGYRVARDIPFVDANEDLVVDIKRVSGSIDQMFGTIAPTIARQLKDKLIVDATYAAMDHSPDLALEILDMGSIEGSRRHAIEEQIKHAEKAQNATNVAAFDEKRRNWVTMVEEGKKQEKIPLSQYQLYYPANQAVDQKSKDDTLIDIHNGVNQFMSKISSWSPQHQLKAVNEFKSRVGSREDTAFVDSKISDVVNQKVTGSGGTVDQARRDPVRFLATNNPNVKRLVDSFSSSPEGPNKQVTMDQMLDAIVRYQGPAPEKLPEGDDARMYLAIPRNQVKIMSSQEAEQAAAQINQGSPKDALKAIASVLENYPEKYKPIAFADLTKLPEGKRIKGEYWAANLNMNASWVNDYLGVLQNAESIKKVSAGTVGEFEKALNGNTDWLTFVNPGAADNFQRETVVEDFKNGIMLYAMGIAQQSGQTPEKAVKLATERILKEELGFGNVNGKTVMIPKNPGPGKPYRSDDDVKHIARRLDTALLFLNPKDVKLTDEFGRDIFPTLNVAGNEETKLRALQRAIHENGTFHTSPDGKTAILYYDDGVNQPFEMRDKKNRAFTIEIDKLPAFRTIQMPDFFGGRPETFFMSDVGLYDTTFHPSGNTNWPPVIPFWKYQQR